MRFCGKDMLDATSDLETSEIKQCKFHSSRARSRALEWNMFLLKFKNESY